jgi:hypothetical protein
MKSHNICMFETSRFVSRIVIVCEVRDLNYDYNYFVDGRVKYCHKINNKINCISLNNLTKWQCTLDLDKINFDLRGAQI